MLHKRLLNWLFSGWFSTPRNIFISSLSFILHSHLSAHPLNPTSLFSTPPGFPPPLLLIWRPSSCPADFCRHLAPALAASNLTLSKASNLSPEPNHAGNLILDFYLPKLWEINFCCLSQKNNNNKKPQKPLIHRRAKSNIYLNIKSNCIAHLIQWPPFILGRNLNC